MSKWDPSIVVAIVTVVGVVISAGFGTLVALATNRKEKNSSALRAVELATEKASAEKEEALRERLQLRDEQNVALRLHIVDLEAEISRLRRKQRDS